MRDVVLMDKVTQLFRVKFDQGATAIEKFDKELYIRSSCAAAESDATESDTHTRRIAVESVA